MQLAADTENTMLAYADALELGPGTGALAGPPPPIPGQAGPPAGNAPGQPSGPPTRWRVRDDLPDAPPRVRVGDHAPLPDGVRVVDEADIAAMLGGRTR